MLQIENLETVAGSFCLRGVCVEAPAGSYGVLLGPPGSGKSVLVEAICGLRKPIAGRILIDGEDVTDFEPRERRVGYVPQDYVLFPRKTAVDNIIFGLRARGVERDEAIKQIEPIVDLLHIESLLDRWPATLSGGEQQRVALARALSIKPRLLLLDEPVSALDEALRERVCRELRQFQRELGITTIHISHNLEEALAVSDWAAILDHGAVQQYGPMMELLRKPGNDMVARFLRCENIFPAVANPSGDDRSCLRFAGHEVCVGERAEGEVTVVIRPELVRVSEQGAGGENGIEAELTDVADRSLYRRLEFDAGVRIVAFVPAVYETLQFEAGHKYALTLPPDDLHVISR